MCRNLSIRVSLLWFHHGPYSLVVFNVTIVAYREDGRILQSKIETSISNILSRLTERESERMGEKEEDEDEKKFISFWTSRRDVCTVRLRRVFEFFGKYWTSSSTGRGLGVYLNTALHGICTRTRDISSTETQYGTSVLMLEIKSERR